MKSLKEVQAYAKKVIPLIGLSHWDIEFIDPEKQVEDALAQAKVKFNYKEATIKIFDAFFDEDQNNQESTIIHELLHCHMSFWEVSYNDGMKGNPEISTNSERLVYSSIQSSEEESVELLARALHKSLKI